MRCLASSFIALLLVGGSVHAQGSGQRIEQASFITVGGIEQWVTIRGDEVRGETKQAAPGGKHEFRTAVPQNYPAMIDLLKNKSVTIEIEPQHDAPFITASPPRSSAGQRRRGSSPSTG